MDNLLSFGLYVVPPNNLPSWYVLKQNMARPFDWKTLNKQKIMTISLNFEVNTVMYQVLLWLLWNTHHVTDTNFVP